MMDFKREKETEQYYICRTQAGGVFIKKYLPSYAVKISERTGFVLEPIETVKKRKKNKEGFLI